MDLGNGATEFCLDDLSECSSDSLDGDYSDENDIISQKLSSALPLHGSDTESDNDNKEDVEMYDNVWSTIDKQITLESFEGSPGIKIMPKSRECVGDIVDLFIGEDFFEHMVKESNRYHYQIQNRYKNASKKKKWTDITAAEMKKFVGLIVLMGQVKKETLHDYWSTDPTIETPIFSKVMSRNRFMEILQTWHFSNNEDIGPSSNRLIKVQPVIDYFKKKFNDVYKPLQQLSLYECIIPWRGKHTFRVCNPVKLIKHGIIVRAICEASTGYICNFDIHTAEGKKLEETMLTVINPYKNLWHHIYLDNYYNSVNIAQTLLKKKVRLCGIIQKNRGLPQSLQSVKLSSGESVFRRNNDVLLQTWNNGKKNINMISTIHSARLVEFGKLHKRTKIPMQKPETILDYNKYMTGIDRADQYLAYYSIIRKTKKWTKRVVMYFINCALFNSFRVYTELNGKKKMYKKFLHEVAIAWITHSETAEPVDLTNIKYEAMEGRGIEETVLSNVLNTSESTRSTPKLDHPQRLSNLKNHKLVKIVTSGKSKMPQRQCRVCASKKIRSRTCFVCKFCNIPLHKGDCYERYHTLSKY